MTPSKRRAAVRSEVAMWHELSGMPDNVTDEGDIVPSGPGRRLQSDKQLLRASIDNLSSPERPKRVRDMVRLAASYLLAGDVETARRYVDRARQLLQECGC